MREWEIEGVGDWEIGRLREWEVRGERGEMRGKIPLGPSL